MAAAFAAATRRCERRCLEHPISPPSVLNLACGMFQEAKQILLHQPTTWQEHFAVKHYNRSLHYFASKGNLHPPIPSLPSTSSLLLRTCEQLLADFKRLRQANVDIQQQSANLQHQNI